MTSMKAIYIFLLVSASSYALIISVHDRTELRYSPEKSYRKLRAAGAATATQDNAPKVEIKFPGAPEKLTWNTQTRYTIHVSDPKDGESQYGEIDARAVLMRIEYIPAQNGINVEELIERSRKAPEHPGLSLMKRSTCFGCHADKSRLAGPSFEEISDKYRNKPGIAAELGQHIVDGSTGIWGSQTMPSHPDLTIEEATQIAAFILEQGGNKNRWIYPGLEGSFRTIAKPESDDHGVYVLTAGYVSTSDMRGECSVVLGID